LALLGAKPALVSAAGQDFSDYRGFLQSATLAGVALTAAQHRAVAAPTVAQNFIEKRYSCQVCNPGTIKVLPPQKYYEFTVTQNPDHIKPSPLAIPAFTCESPSAKTLGMTNALNTIEGCEYYARGFDNVLFCQRCEIGSNSIVFQVPHHCLVFQENTFQCTRCRPGFYLTAVGSVNECKEVVDTPNCVAYDSAAASTVCTQCAPDYYLDANGCVLRQASFRIAYSKVDVAADTYTCIAGYIYN